MAVDEIEKSATWDYCLLSLGKYSDAKGSSGQIFLSHPHTHDSFIYSMMGLEF